MTLLQVTMSARPLGRFPVALDGDPAIEDWARNSALCASAGLLAVAYREDQVPRFLYRPGGDRISRVLQRPAWSQRLQYSLQRMLTDRCVFKIPPVLHVA